MHGRSSLPVLTFSPPFSTSIPFPPLFGLDPSQALQLTVCDAGLPPGHGENNCGDVKFVSRDFPSFRRGWKPCEVSTVRLTRSFDFSTLAYSSRAVEQLRKAVALRRFVSFEVVWFGIKVNRK